MARTWFPALRGRLAGLETKAPTAQDQPDVRDQRGVETKTITLGGFQSTTSAAVWGLEDRAAGWDLNTVVVEGYERCVWSYRCIEKLGGDQARLKFRFGRNLDEDDEEVLEDHPLYRVLNKQANPLENGYVFRKRLSGQVFLSKKGAFVEVTKSRAGSITRVDLLPPDRVYPRPSDNGLYIKHFEYWDREGQMREIDPERIRWVREPHPTDPFSGVTPLEAAGLSIELDQLARTYNVTFIKRDARPGGVIGVDVDGIEESDLDRTEAKLQPGAQNAGYTAVVGTGPGGLTFIDTSAKPRDMAYSETAENAKEEILTAFGIGESVLASAAGRTFDNAEQEDFNYWAGPQRNHHSLIAMAFAVDAPDDYEPFMDTSGVHSLELPRRKARQEAREEYNAGLRSIDEYRPMAGLPRVRNAQTRALWVSPAKAPIPTDPGDAAALGADTGAGGEQQPGQERAGGQQGGGTAADAVEAARGGASGAGTAADAVAAARGQAPGGGGTAADAVEQARGASEQGGQPAAAAAAVDAARGVSEQGGQPGAAAAAVQAALQTKGLDLADGETVYDAGDEHLTRCEAAIAGALDAILARQVGVITARLESPKLRKGTRWWQADGPTDTRAGTAPLDAAAVVDEDRWAKETEDTLMPVVVAQADDAARALLEYFADAGTIIGARDGLEVKASPTAARGGMAAALTAVTIAVEAMRGWLRKVAARIIAVEAGAASIQDVAGAVHNEYAQHAHTFAETLAATIGQAAIAGARDAAAAALTPMPGQDTTGIVRSWITRADARVRDSHAAVAGETLPIGEHFVVGGASLRYPGDPFGPPGETRNCRCRLIYRFGPAKIS